MLTTLEQIEHMTTDTQSKPELINAGGKYIGTTTSYTTIEGAIHQKWNNLEAQVFSSPEGTQESLGERIMRHRNEMGNIINGRSDKTAMIVGPCSVHDKEGMKTYLRNLADLQRELDANNAMIKLIPRIYGEKPRSKNSADRNGTLSWRGIIANASPDQPQQDIIHDPAGLEIMRELMLYAYEIDLGVATEFLNMETVAELGHLPTVIAVGARTIGEEKFQHMAADMGQLGIAVGFKNDENGDPQPAIDAINNVHNQNPNAFLILRGGEHGANWQRYHELQTREKGICIDANHSNSGKDLNETIRILRELEIQPAEQRPRMVMLESYTEGGNKGPDEQITPDKSITDPCLDFAETRRRILALNNLPMAA